MCTSTDARTWTFPKVVFPVYKLRPPDKPGQAMMHQRMGFFIAPDGRLLILAFYGQRQSLRTRRHRPRGAQIYKDGSFGPIYFLRYNTRSGWGETNTGFPYYKHSPDAGFIAACDALLANRLMREQSGTKNISTTAISSRSNHTEGQEAFHWFHRKDGKLVGL